MSTLSLPSYVAPSRTPSYTVVPHHSEQRLALADRLRPRPEGDFIKESKGGGTRLRLSAQESNAALPVYGSADTVEGHVELSKPESITSVEVKIEGRLLIKEIAEGGTSAASLCLNTALLWIKDVANPQCPSSLHFSLALPNTFTYADKTYPLPPSFNVKLSGLPGFVATIDYSVTAIVAKANHGVTMPKVKSKALGIHIGSTHVSTPFIYYPRTRPAAPVPPPLQTGPTGFNLSLDWKVFETIISSKSSARPNIVAKLYLPASRIFCMSKPIPFHLSFESSAVSLAAFLPFSPITNSTTSRRATRIQIMRQTTVDVRNTMIAGVKTDMWRVDALGEGTFQHAGDGPSWTAFSGEIVLGDISIPPFKAAGLSLKDCLLFTVTPPDPAKATFSDLREVVPIRLTTDPWIANGTGIGARPDYELWESSTPPTPEKYESLDL